jgi:hypothetical protein
MNIAQLPRWRNSRILVMDANFKADHLIMRNPEDDVKLMDGEGYFVNDAKYQKHLRTAKESNHVCPLFLEYLSGQDAFSFESLIVIRKHHVLIIRLHVS